MTRAALALAALLASPCLPAVAGEFGFTRDGEVFCASKKAAVEQGKVKHLQQLVAGCGRVGRGWRYEVARVEGDGLVKVRLWPPSRRVLVVWQVR